MNISEIESKKKEETGEEKHTHRDKERGGGREMEKELAIHLISLKQSMLRIRLQHQSIAQCYLKFMTCR